MAGFSVFKDGVRSHKAAFAPLGGCCSVMKFETAREMLGCFISAAHSYFIYAEIRQCQQLGSMRLTHLFYIFPRCFSEMLAKE